MSADQHQELNPNKLTIYEIRIKGHLGHDWEDWFDNVSITKSSEGETSLTCAVRDQSALHSLLRRIRDLGIPLISVVCLESNDSEN